MRARTKVARTQKYLSRPAFVRPGFQPGCSHLPEFSGLPRILHTAASWPHNFGGVNPVFVAGPLLHNLVNGWRRVAVIRGFLWLKFFYKLFVCLALRQLLHPPKNGQTKTTVHVEGGQSILEGNRSSPFKTL